MGTSADALVIGYGNELRADDGIGPAVAKRLRSDPRATRVRVLAVRQLTPDLALDMARASLVVLVDATVKVEPGVIAVRELSIGERAADTGSADAGAADAGAPDAGAPDARAPDAGSTAFTHHTAAATIVGLAATLYAARPRVVVVSIGAGSLAFDEGLSAEATRAVPAAVDAILDLVSDAGTPASPDRAPGAHRPG